MEQQMVNKQSVRSAETYFLWRHIERYCSQVDDGIVVDAGQNEK